MLRRFRGVPVTIAATGLMLGIVALPATVTASAANAPAWRTHVCHGTQKHPGQLTGLNLNVIVRGVCVARRGPVAVSRNIIVTRHSTLIAAFGRHHTHITVAGSVLVRKGGTLILGCNPESFPCLDDPHPNRPSLTSRDIVRGGIFGTAALGMIVHNDRIGHTIRQTGGGGGVACKPKGPFKQFHSPVYSTYEDNSVGGSLRVKHLHSCWLGVIRNKVGHNVRVVFNKMADPDANEVVTNRIQGDLTCFHNNPKAQFGDSHGKPNRVGRHAFLECSFKRIIPNPAGQHQHFSHISVPLRHK